MKRVHDLTLAELINKPISWHKKQAARSERFSEIYAKKLGLTTQDLRLLSKKDGAH